MPGFLPLEVLVNAPIYLDYNATTPIAPEVLEAMMPYLTEHFGNPSSSHAFGRAAKDAVEEARQKVASLLGVKSHEIFFTSGGTEGNNLAILGAVPMFPEAPGRKSILTSTIEHPASSRPAELLETRGWELRRVGANAHGLIDLDAFDDLFDQDVLLTTIMHANNEIGTIQPIAAIAERTERAGSLLHVDGAQTVGKIPVDLKQLGVDMFTIVGHKFYAPKGVGALYVREGVELDARSHGAGHERGLRPGTENVASIVGLGAACELAGARLADESKRLVELRTLLANNLQSACPDMVISGKFAPRLPQTLHICLPGKIGADVLSHAPELMASTGAACRGPDDPPSATLTAIGYTPEVARGAIRLSLGHGTTRDEIERASRLLIEAIAKSRSFA